MGSMRSAVIVALLLASGPVLADKPVAVPNLPHKALCADNGQRFRCFAHAQTDAEGNVKASFTPFGFGAPDLQDAYHIDISKDPGNVTVAIIDAYGYPNLESDLAAYRTQFNLPACTKASGCLTIVNTSGGTSPLPGNAPAGDDWTGETALDMDMVSAACPKCKILVVQADNDVSNGLLIGNTTAAQKGATFVSNSWGQQEPSSGTIGNEETNFSHAGVIYFASTGDQGFLGNSPQYPASSAHVFAVGGTSLVMDTTSVRGWKETAWNGAGSSCSRSIAKPTWQTDSVCAKRSTADISAVADPSTGVAVFNADEGGWTVVGGTSASSPFVAAVFAQTGHANATGDFPYTNAAMFFDVVGGNNGSCQGSILCTSVAGWDGPTGVGTPNGPMLAGALAPTLSSSPGNAASVPPGFELDVTCTSNDAATIKQVDIIIDGEHFGKLTMTPFTFKAPSTFANGKHAISIECTTSSLASAQTAFNVTQVPPCTVDADCPSTTDTCFDGGCIPGTGAPGGLGADCKVDGDCVSTMCGSDGTSNHCVVPCDGAMGCPGGFSCLSAGPTGVCWPAADDGGGGCDSSSGGGRGAPLVLGLGLAALLIARRRT